MVQSSLIQNGSFPFDKPILLKVLVISAKCLNPHCKVKSFCLPVKGIIKYQRATNRVFKEGVAGNVLDNTPPQKVKGRFACFFNLTGSRRTLDRWKHEEADKLNFKDLIEKPKPSKVVCLDDLDPERYTPKHLVSSDRIKSYILYLAALPNQSEEEVVRYLAAPKSLGISSVPLHSLRHSLATHLLESGIGLCYIQEILRAKKVLRAPKHIPILAIKI